MRARTNPSAALLAVRNQSQRESTLPTVPKASGELCRKLIGKFDFPQRDADQIATFLRRAGVVGLPTELAPVLYRDPTEVPVPGSAVAGECALLVSIDRDPLDTGTVHEIPSIRPGDY
jgi:hypothetical protein